MAMVTLSTLTASAEQSVQDHGVVAPVGQAGWGGIHATVDGEGKRVILIQLWTGSGQENERRLLIVDAETGDSEIVNPPVGQRGGFAGSFGTFLSSKNRFYNILQVEGKVWFMEYDVASGEWTGLADGPSSSKGWLFANTFTEDDNGIIYAGLLPNGQLLAFDPETKKLTDHGRFGEWERRTDPVISTDSSGWIYAAMLYQQADIVAWKPGETKPESLLAEEYHKGVRSVNMYRATNGKVYIKYEGIAPWFELFEGKLTESKFNAPESQLRRGGWRDPMLFPDGSKIKNINVPSKVATIVNLDGSEHEIRFEYDSAGVATYSVEAGPDGKIYGSTGIPLRFFRFDPESGQMDNWGLASNGGHVNDICVQGDKLYGAVYGTGSLFVYDPSQPWEDRSLSQTKNPRELYRNQQYIGRPFAVVAHSGGDHVLMGGNPYRSETGGGLVIHQVSTGKNELLEPSKLVADQGISSLAALPNGNVLIGTTTDAGTGGTRTAKAACVLLLNWETKTVAAKVELSSADLKVSDLLVLNDKQALGITHGNNPLLFVLDIEKMEVAGSTRLAGYGGLSGSQGARVLSMGPDGQVYVLFYNQIVRVNPADLSSDVAVKVPLISTGSAWLNGRLYFTSGPRLMSWAP